MTNRYFRAGVGTVIYRSDGTVALFKRRAYPAGIWQFQQGGIDSGEVPEETLWRELTEEVGLADKHIALVTEVPGWIAYEDLDEEQALPDRIGQAHRWFFLKLKDEVTIDLSTATEQEFDDVRWVSFPEAIDCCNSRKRHVYESLYAYFIEKLENK